MALVLQTLLGLFSGPLFVLKNAMLADITDEIELKYGHRPTGLVYSAAGFSFKFGFTIGGAVAGYTLGWYGYEANQAQAPDAVEGLRVLMSWIPLVPTVIAAVLLLLYPLHESQVEINATQLEARRSQEDTASPEPVASTD
jgi:GPH family glycoside/pentoside/hexuronide:cation symporter